MQCNHVHVWGGEIVKSVTQREIRDAESAEKKIIIIVFSATSASPSSLCVTLPPPYNPKGNMRSKIFIILMLILFANNSYADDKRYSLDSMLGNLAEKFQSQMLTRTDFSRISQVKPNQYRIPKDLKMKAMISIPKLVQQGRVVKSIGVGGQPGYIITYLEQGSVYRTLGLKVGDFLSKLNDAPLTDDKQIMQIFSNNKNADNIRLELVRQKTKLVLSYNFV